MSLYMPILIQNKEYVNPKTNKNKINKFNTTYFCWDWL